jgi:ABC-2 type transport system permease protein
MRKVLLIGWKDVVLSFRDRAALILMLVAPFVLTLGLGFVTGRFSGQSASGVSDIPVVVVDEDGETLGSELVEILKSQELEDLLATSVEVDRQAAERKVDEDKAAVAIVIPTGFTQSVVSGGETVQIVLYTNPTRPTSSGVVQTIMDGFLSQLEAARVGGEVTVEQLLTSGRIQAAEAPAVAARIAEQMTKATASESIQVRGEIRGSESVQFDALAYMAPGMALMFLMFTVTNGGRTLIAERVLGTLPRLLVSPRYWEAKCWAST